MCHRYAVPWIRCCFCHPIQNVYSTINAIMPPISLWRSNNGWILGDAVRLSITNVSDLPHLILDQNNGYDIIKAAAVQEGVTHVVRNQGKKTQCMHVVLEQCMESTHAYTCARMLLGVFDPGGGHAVHVKEFEFLEFDIGTFREGHSDLFNKKEIVSARRLCLRFLFSLCNLGWGPPSQLKPVQ